MNTPPLPLLLLASVCFIIGCDDRKVDENPSPSVSVADPGTRSSTDELRSAIDFRLIEDALPLSEYRDGSEHDVFSLPETTGGGSALVDYDSDGRLDVITAGGGFADAANKQMIGFAGNLYKQSSDGRFVPSGPMACMDFSASYHSAMIAAD